MRKLLLALAVTLASACNDNHRIVDQSDVAPTERGLGTVASDHLRATEALATKNADWARALPWVVTLPMLLTANAATSAN